MLIKYIYRVGMTGNHQSNAGMENYEIRPLNKPITVIMSQHTRKCMTKIVKMQGQIASYAKQNTSAQLPFHTRLDPLKLARDPLNIIAESPRDL